MIRGVLLTAALAALALAGCGSDKPESATSSTATGTTAARPPEASDIVAKAQPSVVAVKGKEGNYHTHGTGVIIDARRGLVLTSNHLIETAETIDVTIGERQTVKARPLARAMCQDIALLGLYAPTPTGLVALPFGDSSGVRAGDSTIALGYHGLQTSTGAEKLSSAASQVSAAGASTELTPLLPVFSDLIAHQASLAASDSGGPLLDAEGRFVGMDTVMPDAKDDGLAYAISSNRIKQLYEELVPGDTSVYSGWEKYHKCHGRLIELAKKARVLNHDLPAGTTTMEDDDEMHSEHH